MEIISQEKKFQGKGRSVVNSEGGKTIQYSKEKKYRVRKSNFIGIKPFSDYFQLFFMKSNFIEGFPFSGHLTRNNFYLHIMFFKLNL